MTDSRRDPGDGRPEPSGTGVPVPDGEHPTGDPYGQPLSGWRPTGTAWGPQDRAPSVWGGLSGPVAGPQGWGPPGSGGPPGGAGPGGPGGDPGGPGGYGFGPGGPGSFSGGPGQPARRGTTPRAVVLGIAAIALVAVLVRTGHVHAISIMLFGVLVPSVILHEVSHGWVANVCGDDTARRAGRLTLNPLAHVDVLGTIIVPVVMVLSGVGAFGWAKPVPVNVSRLRHPRNQAVLVALVGPGVNIALAALAAVAFRGLVPAADKAGQLTALPAWVQVLFLAGYVNVILAVFNLIPLPPLDGSAVLERLLPARWLPTYYRIRPFTLLLPFALVLLSGGTLLDHLFDPALNWWGHVVG